MPLELAAHLDAVLEAWRDVFGAPEWRACPYELHRSGPELRVEQASRFGFRTVGGRASAWGLLASRVWAASVLDPDAYRLCPAWLPTLSEGPSGLGAVIEQFAVAPALRELAIGFEAEEELDEAALCLARSVPAGVVPDVEGISPRLRARFEREPPRGRTPLARVMAGLKDADPVRRLAAVREAETGLDEVFPGSVLETHSVIRGPLRALLTDAQPAVQERALSLTEAWARRLVGAGAYREALPLLEELIEAGVALGDMLRLRHEARLAVGDRAGARNDLVRLRSFRARLASAGGRVGHEPAARAAEPLEPWQAATLERVARAHLSWAAGRDPCPDRPATVATPAPEVVQRHLAAARSRIDEALGLLAADAGESRRRLTALRATIPAGGRRRH